MKTKIRQGEPNFNAQKYNKSRGFQGLRPLDPTRAVPWTRWETHDAPRPPHIKVSPQILIIQ